jgi:phage shock protein C
MEKKLYRDEFRKKVGGVCAGLADYFGIDVTVVRLIFALSFFLKGVGLIPYIILWAVLPKRNSLTDGNLNRPGYNPNFGTPSFDAKVDYTVPPTPFGQQVPFGQPAYTEPKKSSSGIIFGVVMIVLGSVFLLDNLDFIPELDFENLWPVVLVAVGLALIVTGQKKQPWDKTDWQQPKEPIAEEPAATTDTTEHNSDNNQTL